ncbi:MAG: hypothetical protein ACM3N4_12350, partial [Nitrososphaerota archaeon]
AAYENCSHNRDPYPAAEEANPLTHDVLSPNDGCVQNSLIEPIMPDMPFGCLSCFLHVGFTYFMSMHISLVVCRRRTGVTPISRRTQTPRCGTKVLVMTVAN